MKKRHTSFIVIITILSALVVVACGSRPSADESSAGSASVGSSTGSSVAAMPTASFKSVGEQSNITTTIDLEDDESDDEENAAAIALGERVYGNKCAECHGPSGEGDGNAPAIAGTELSFDDFEDLLRTGGEIGPEHLFGTQAVSANGVAGLHAFLTSSK